MILRQCIVILLSLFMQSMAYSQLSLPRVFSSNMVLQRDVVIPIWGKGKAGELVSVEFDSQSYSTKTETDGSWQVEIPSHQAGGTYILHVKSVDDFIELTNITFGDVWLCGGQSNMEWYVERSKNEVVEIEQADYPNIRLITVPHKMATHPKDNWEEGEWEKCSSESIPQFSAVGYFFGRDLHQATGVPIGLINNNWGGTVAQTWISEEGFDGLPKYLNQIEELKNLDLEKEKTSGDAAFNDWLGNFQLKDLGYNTETEKYTWPHLSDYTNWKEMVLPGLWEGGSDEELHERDGVVWFQKSIRLTAEQAAKSAEWFFGPIDDTDKTWINGQLIGETYNHYNEDRHYEINDGVLKEGINSIVIRVEDYVGGGGPYGDPGKFYLDLKEEQISLAGTWRYKIGYLTKTPLPNNAFGPNAFPSMLYNGMIAPMTKLPIKGVIWYQGESNASVAFEYRDIFQRLIQNWRTQFNQPKLPFLYVQLANFTNELDKPALSKWAELREAQAMALSLTNTAMITTIDIGDAGNIHPENKQEVGRRLSLAALNTVYKQEEVNYQGPIFNEKEMVDDYVLIHFQEKDTLAIKDKYGYIKGFTISGGDQVFHWAKAEQVDENTVKVWSKAVKHPKAVRYAWADNPQPANIYSKTGFPAFPFRTDNWPLSTE